MIAPDESLATEIVVLGLDDIVQMHEIEAVATEMFSHLNEIQLRRLAAVAIENVVRNGWAQLVMLDSSSRVLPRWIPLDLETSQIATYIESEWARSGNRSASGIFLPGVIGWLRVLPAGEAHLVSIGRSPTTPSAG